MNDTLPEWARLARMKWKYTGQKRPPMADIPQPGEESVWDYPRPPIVREDTRTISVRFQKTILAQSQNALRVLETASPPTIYIQFKDITWSHLIASDETSQCEWKGIARYWAFDFGKGDLKICAWDYPNPFPEFNPLKGYVAFYPTKLACFIDDERVYPQPGGLYGGWITQEIVGPFKGEPGTEGW